MEDGRQREESRQQEDAPGYIRCGPEEDRRLTIQLRLTKYDPANRNAEGHYLVDEWTSSQDIGYEFAAGDLSAADYLVVEDAYVAVLSALHADAGAPPLACRGVEIVGPAHEAIPADPKRPVVEAIEEGAMVTAEELATIVRSCLREMVWCRLESPTCSIAFGYDYYTYWLGPVPSATTVVLAKERGLFLEPSSAPAFEPFPDPSIN